MIAVNQYTAVQGTPVTYITIPVATGIPVSHISHEKIPEQTSVAVCSGHDHHHDQYSGSCGHHGAGVKKLPDFKKSKCRKTKGKTTGEFKCRYLDCNQAFSNRFNLKRHVMLVHSRSRTFYCQECDRSFGLLQNYRDHLLLHLPFEEVEKKMAGISPSVTERLPMFMVEKTQEEDLLKAYIDYKPMPKFVEQGVMPHPRKTGQ